MKDIKTEVYDDLVKATNEVQAQSFEVNRLKQEAVRLLHPEENDQKIMKANHALGVILASGRQRAHALVKEYADAVRAEDTLDPSKITDDLQLLKSGVKLTERDVADMLDRNRDNRTMLQLIIRHAQENNISTGGVRYIGYNHRPDGHDLVDGLDTVIDAYFDRYVTTPTARLTLDRFFGK